MSCPCYLPDGSRRTLALPSDPGPLAKEHREIQKRIDEYEAILADLKSEQNTLVRVCQLPPEILSRIFTTYAASVLCERHPLHWIKISHVCRHFRAVALESPSLWASIYLYSLEVAREMLTRSKSVDLVLNYRGSTSFEYAQEGLRALKEALAQVHRIHTLNLQDTSTSELEALVASLREGAPRLQRLSVHKRLGYFFSHNETYLLPLDFINGGAPRLHHIELINCALPWQHWQGLPKFFTPVLTELVLTDTHPGYQSEQNPPLLSQLLNLLEALPALRRLKLQNTLPTTANAIADVPLATRVISLSQLDKLSLKGGCLKCIGLLRSISVSPTTAISLDCVQPAEWLDVCSTLMHTLQECRGSAFKPKKMFVNRFTASSPSFWIWMWDKFDPSNPELSFLEPLECSLDINMQYNPQPVVAALTDTEMFHAVFDTVDFNSLRALEASSRWNQHIWRRYFGSVPNLTHIWVSQSVIMDLAEALVPQQTIGTQSEVRSKMDFLQLQTLYLLQVKFGERGLDVDTFRDMLMLRAAYGSDLHQLFIRVAAHLDRFDVGLMEEIVAIVHWDGVVDSEDEDSRDSSEGEEEDSDNAHSL